MRHDAFVTGIVASRRLRQLAMLRGRADCVQSARRGGLAALAIDRLRRPGRRRGAVSWRCRCTADVVR